MKTPFGPVAAVAAGATLGLILSGLYLSNESKAKMDGCLARNMSPDYCALIVYGR
jgi:hypothetical protein